MNSRFDIPTKGLISLAVMLMFTVALIAGQARANLPAEAAANADFARATQVSIALDTEALQMIDALTHVIDTVLALPIDIELTLRKGSAEDAGSDDASVQ
jgi:hypothetical protein